MLLGDGLELGEDLLVFFGGSGRLGRGADNVPGRTLVDSCFSENAPAYLKYQLFK